MVLKRKKYESNNANRNTAGSRAPDIKRTASRGSSSSACLSGARWSNSSHPSSRWSSRSG